MNLSTRTVVLSTLGLAVVAGLAFVSFRDDPVPVDLVEISRGILEVTVNAEGHTQVRDLYEIASPISGTALRSPVAIGDIVVAGETVVAIVQPSTSGLLDVRTRLQAEASLQEALAARHVAQADENQAQETLAFAQTQFERAEALVNRGVATLTRLEDANQQLAVATAALDAAVARVEMADGSIERARASLLQTNQTDGNARDCCIQVLAPANGVVLSVASISERPIAVGAPLMSIGNPQDLELVADILSSDAVRLMPGAVTYVERWGGDTPLLAQLDRIDPQAYTKVSALGIEEQRVDAVFSLTPSGANWSGLGQGYSVFLRIVEWREEDALLVPLSAIFRFGEDWAVFVATDGQAALRIIELGRRNERMTTVLDGLEAGAHVITHPSDEIADGVSISERSQL